MKTTHSLVQVATALLDDPRGQHWGYELGRAAGVSSGVLYPMLKRLLREGWLEDGWEKQAADLGRPPRRYYTLTDTGIRELGGIVQSARSDRRFAGFNWGGTALPGQA